VFADQTWLAKIIWAVLALLMLDALVQRNWPLAFVSLATLLLSLTPVFAARWAEVVFTVQRGTEEMKAFYDDLHARMDRIGRRPTECAGISESTPDIISHPVPCVKSGIPETSRNTAQTKL